MKENIHFYYTNDLHSYFDHWPQVVTYLNKKRKDKDQRGESSWIIDIGDHMDRVHPITEATMGKANVELLNEAGYDFATVGNNEGITLAHDDFYHLYDQAQFDVICTNLQCTLSENPPWLVSSKIVSSVNGVKIGFLGITAAFNPYYHLLGWHVETAHQAIYSELKKIQDKTDIIVLLSHVGINEDEMIAEKFPQIDVIIGGHTHHLLKTGKMVRNTLLTAAGKHCAYVGEVRLIWDHEENKLIDKEAYAIKVTHMPNDVEAKKQIDQLQEQADAILSSKVAHVDKTLHVDWYAETAITKKFTEKLRQWTNADIAMLNAGLLLDDLPKGEITYKDVHRICPHPVNPCVVELNGDELLEVIRASLTKQFMEFKLRGFGFRGDVLGRMVFSNVKVVTSRHDTGQEYVSEVLFEGVPLDAKQQYAVVTADIFTFGRMLPEIARSENKKLFLPEFLREILVETLKEYKQIRS